MRKNTAYVNLLSELGRSLSIPEEPFSDVKKFVCELYGGKKVESVSDLRYGMFCAKGAEIRSHQLPPSHASLQMHIQRANYQAHIWRSCMTTMAHVPPPDGFGWKLSANELLINWSTENAAPDVVLEFLSCSCKKLCEKEKCSCASNGLPCTDMCKCKDCSNTISIDITPDDEEVEDDEDENDIECEE